MAPSAPPIAVVVAFKLPLLMKGVRTALASGDDICIFEECSTFAATARALRRHHPQVLVTGTGICSARPDGLAVLARASPETHIALLCRTTREFEKQILVDGARAVLPPQTLSEQLVACVRELAAGKSWRGLQRIRGSGVPGRPQGTRGSLNVLTPRERQIAHAVASGKRNREIAEALGISPSTVKLHVSRIFAKVGVSNRVGLLRKMMG